MMLEPGYYWIKVLEPVCDRGGVVDEVWSDPEVALYRDLHWYRAGYEGAVADQYAVQLLAPAERLMPRPDEPASLSLVRFAVDVHKELAVPPEGSDDYVGWEFVDLERAMGRIHRAFERHVGPIISIKTYGAVPAAPRMAGVTEDRG